MKLTSYKTAGILAAGAALYEAWRRYKMGPGAFARPGQVVVVDAAKLSFAAGLVLPIQAGVHAVLQITPSSTGPTGPLFGSGTDNLTGVVLGVEAPTVMGFAPVPGAESGSVAVTFHRADVLKVVK